MNKNEIVKILKEHVEDGETECRWCFAIDLQRIKANIVAQEDYPDATVLHLKCPKCDGEFSYYIRAWAEPYLKDRITKLHPEIEGKISDDLLSEINDRMWPEYCGMDETITDFLEGREKRIVKHFKDRRN